MASFVIHHIAGEHFLMELEKNLGVKFSEKERNDFIFGNLIVDSSRLKKDIPNGLSQEELKEFKKHLQQLVQDEKVSTHFRDKDDYNLCIQVPNLDKFLDKYQDLLSSDFSALGYFFHLYTDKFFFYDLFGKTFKCLDKDMRQTIYLDECVNMLVIKNGKIMNSDDFWSFDKGIYKDYTLMNKILLEHYEIIFDLNSLLKGALNFNSGVIAEVDYQNIFEILKKTDTFIKESYEIDGELNIFTEEHIKDFIGLAVNGFIESYYPLFGDLIEANSKRKRSLD